MNDDIDLYLSSQANELLQRSRQVQNKSEKEKMLRESLKEYQRISTQVDLANVCAQYRQGKKKSTSFIGNVNFD